MTAKSLSYDFLERYFNLDNTFLKTIWHMITKPKDVCGGYISGLRKKYLNPVSMLAISLTLSGFILFLMKKIAWSDIDFSKISYAQTSSGGAGTEKIMSSTMEYSSLLFLFYIPILAFASYLFFNKQKYNLAEHIVTSIYALTSFSIISAVYAIVVLLISPQFYINTALIYSLIMVLFCVYVAYKNSMNTLKSLFWRVPMFLLIFLVGYMGISIVTVAILFLTGEISIQDFTPK
ncbi:DUF3667 domain-containing protein [Wocania ichthyoenteri]|uniref:DUF3667 domain-containing protein n=1 Tax=Wocania ichthyoenteri TaxID=1230531 RepID=UPI00138E2ECA|nr:DUF3667 domain-containing protein [Wocania ichthyoenteri]